ncbi:MAG TPA: hypothetical protein PKC21_03520 [Oligoflexia bacterium]|nr:hypothetical protein [Oligoflexia bacterium]HMR24405.1 hypothetical protein [Oligoflexia bacterium]
MQGVSLGIDIQTSHIDIYAVHQKQFCSIDIPGQKQNNRIDIDFSSSTNNYVFNKKTPIDFNANFIPYELIWGVEKQSVDPFFLHTFPEHFIFDNNKCIGLETFNEPLLFHTIFQNYFKLLSQTIYKQLAKPVTTINLHAPEHQSSFLKNILKTLLENSFNCKVTPRSSKNIILQQSASTDIPQKKQVHLFTNYTKPYLYYHNVKTNELYYHLFTQNIYRLDLAFLEKLKHQFIKSIAPYNVSFNAYQRNQLFYAASHIRHGLNQHHTLKAFIPALCYSNEYGLHDFNFNIQRDEYGQFVQQNSSVFLKEMDAFFLKNKILPHDINSLYLHGEGLNVPGLATVLAHYFQKPKETIVADPTFVTQHCINF